MDDRRKFPRLDTDEIGVMWRRASGLDNLDKAKNISGGGVCLVIDKSDLKLYDVIQFEFGLPKSKIVHARAKIAWIKDLDSQQEIGIEFIDISDEDREDIKKFVLKTFSQEGQTET